MKTNSVDMSVTIGKMHLKNPVMPASGTFGYGSELADFVDINSLGAIIVKGTAIKPRLGSFQHRFVEIAGCASACTVGLQGIGVHRFINEKLPYLRQFDTPVIVNIVGESTEEFAQVAEVLSKTEGVSGLEINISCPNVKRGGIHFGVDPDLTFEVVKAVKDVTDLTVISKLTPNVTDITVFARVSEEAGADAISLINGLGPGMVIDVNTRKSKLGKNLVAGLAGPWIKPLAVRQVWQVANVVKVPIIGVGGITCAEDALEFLIVGATAIQIGTYNLVDPTVTIKTIEGIKKYLINNGYKSIQDIIGCFKQT
jgi:dihydroorotate dehydrogenase (NAD+) catalytic subunit